MTVHGMAFEGTSDIAYWNVTDDLYVGGSDQGAGGTGYLTIDDLGRVDVAGNMAVFADGTVTVTAGGTVNSDADIAVNGGAVEIQSGGAFNLEPDRNMSVTNGGNFTAADLYVLDDGSFFKVKTGGTMNFDGGLNIGYYANGELLVDGPGSTVTTGDTVWGDNFAFATVTVKNEAAMETGDLRLAISDSPGTGADVQILSGADMTASGILRLAPSGGTSTSATLTVDGAGSTFTQNDISMLSIRVGNTSTGTAVINVQNGGRFTTGMGETTVREQGVINLDSDGVFDARGPLSVDGQFNFLGGTLYFDEFIGTLENQSGTLAPGHSPGIASITGDYTQQAGAALQIEISGNDNSDLFNPEFDLLSVGGTATLDGLLDVSLLGGFVLTPGEQFAVLSAGSVIDNGLSLGGAAASAFTMLIDGSSVILKVVSPVLPGDYNGDDTVDAADYTAWRDAMTAGATVMLNDNTLGVVDESDFAYWRAHFGETLGSGAGARQAAVPEPATMVMLLVGILAMFFRRRAAVS